MIAEFYLSDGSDCIDYMETTRHTLIVVIVAIEATAKIPESTAYVWNEWTHFTINAVKACNLVLLWEMRKEVTVLIFKTNFQGILRREQKNNCSKVNGKKFDWSHEEIFEEKEIDGSGRAGVTVTLNWTGVNDVVRHGSLWSLFTFSAIAAIIIWKPSIAVAIVAWVSGLPKGLGEKGF